MPKTTESNPAEMRMILSRLPTLFFMIDNSFYFILAFFKSSWLGNDSIAPDFVVDKAATAFA